MISILLKIPKSSQDRPVRQHREPDNGAAGKIQTCLHLISIILWKSERNGLTTTDLSEPIVSVEFSRQFILLV